MTLQVQPKDRTVNVNGLKLHFLDWGDPGSPVLLLLHGLRGHAHSWDDFAAAMCDKYHVLALDQRGRGDSHCPADGDYSTAAFVGDLAGFCQSLELNRFTLMGHSMGGRNSMAFAGQYPELLEKLFIVDIGPTVDPRGANRIRQEIIDVPEEFDSFKALVAYMSKQNRYASDTVLRRRLKYASKELPNGKVGWRYDRAIREQVRRGTGAPSVDLWPLIEKVTCPTVIVRAVDTDLLARDTAERMLEVIPDAQLVEIPQAAHMVFEDNPDGFLAGIRPYL
jgi:esterase